MEEISQNGPIVCSCSTPPNIYAHKSGIYKDLTGQKSFDHECELVGFGVENGEKYWHVKNTWGTYFGEGGFFKVARGINNIAIETNCSWAIPLDTWSEGKQVNIDKSQDKNRLDYEPREHKVNKKCRQNKTKFLKGEKITNPRPGMLFEEGEFPDNFDWRNVFDFNYLSRVTNQNTPRYCDSCWAFAPSSALADRFIIQHQRKNLTVSLNSQVLINCKAGGDCSGGNPGEVYEFAHWHGIPDNSCFNYEAANYNDTCNLFEVCRDCKGPPPKLGENLLENCRTITDYTRYFVSEYGHVLRKFTYNNHLAPKTDEISTGHYRKYYDDREDDFDNKEVHYMKAEIINRGPISCGIHNTQEFQNYAGGLFSQEL